MKTKKLNKEVRTLAQFGSKNLGQTPSPTDTGGGDPTITTITVVTTTTD